MLLTVSLLCIVTFIAGLIDSIAGGGGLLRLPALLIAGVSPQQALGTNKFTGAIGTGAAMLNFARKGGAGLTGMLNVICFSFFMFALLEMLTRSGVFDIMLGKLHNASKTPRQAELVTILICFVGSVAIGAASITILFVGPLVRKLLETHNIERTRGSNLMDGISTGFAGLVPYNPVCLNAVSLAIASGVVGESFSFLDFIPYNFQSIMLIVLFTLSAITGVGRRFDKPQAAK